MAVVFADPFGSYIDGFERGQENEIQYQQNALDTFTQEMDLLDKFVLAPQRQLAKEQRQYARELDLLVRREAGADRRQAERILMQDLGGARQVSVDPGRISTVLGGLGTISEPGSASVGRINNGGLSDNVTGLGRSVPGTPYYTGT